MRILFLLLIAPSSIFSQDFFLSEKTPTSTLDKSKVEFVELYNQPQEKQKDQKSSVSTSTEGAVIIYNDNSVGKQIINGNNNHQHQGNCCKNKVKLKRVESKKKIYAPQGKKVGRKVPYLLSKKYVYKNEKEMRHALIFDLGYVNLKEDKELVGGGAKAELLGAELGYRYALSPSWSGNLSVGKHLFPQEDWRSVVTNFSLGVGFSLTGSMLRYNRAQYLVEEFAHKGSTKIVKKKVSKKLSKEVDYSGLRAEGRVSHSIIHGKATGSQGAFGVGAGLYYDQSLGSSSDFFGRLGVRYDKVKDSDVGVDFHTFFIYIGLGGWL